MTHCSPIWHLVKWTWLGLILENKHPRHLFFVPFGITLGYLEWGPAAVFILNILASHLTSRGALERDYWRSCCRGGPGIRCFAKRNIWQHYWNDRVQYSAFESPVAFLQFHIAQYDCSSEWWDWNGPIEHARFNPLKRPSGSITQGPIIAC